MRLGWRSSWSGAQTPVRLSVQGPTGEVPATAPFSIPLHHRYRRWKGGVSRPHSFFFFCFVIVTISVRLCQVCLLENKSKAPITAHL